MVPPVEPLAVLALQVAMSLTVYGLLAAWFVMPFLRRRSAHAALILLTLPHLIRYVSAVSLTPGIVVGPGMPPHWAWTVTLGDLSVVVLALATVNALRRRTITARFLAVACHVVGMLDILHVGYLAKRLVIVSHLGAQWFVVANLVPMLIVTHTLALAILWHRWQTLAMEAAGEPAT